MLKRYLVEELGVADSPNSPKPVFRLAFENDLMLPAPLEGWLGYADRRVDTAHAYSGEKARAALEIVGDFIEDATALYRTMSGRSWK